MRSMHLIMVQQLIADIHYILYELRTGKVCKDDDSITPTIRI